MRQNLFLFCFGFILFFHVQADKNKEINVKSKNNNLPGSCLRILSSDLTGHGGVETDFYKEENSFHI